jgi:DNA-binding response OmpR family regulator
MPATLLVLRSSGIVVETIRASVPDAEIVSSESPAAAVNACCAIEPDCAIVDAEVSADDLRSFVTAIRVQPTGVAALVIVVLSSHRDEAARIERLRAGADLLLPWPISATELAARLDATLRFASRLRDLGAASSRRAVLTPRTPRAAVWIDADRSSSGTIERATIASVLAMIEAKQASGKLSIGRTEAARQRLVLEIVDGNVTRGRGPGETLSAEDAIDAALQWSSGHYEFVPGTEPKVPALKPPEPLAPPRPPVEKRTTSRSSMGWKAQAEPAKQTPPSARMARRQTLQSTPAVREPGESSSRRTPAITVEPAKQRARTVPPPDGPSADGDSPARRRSATLASQRVDTGDDQEQQEVPTRRPS